MPGCEDQSSPRAGDGAYPLSRTDQACSRTRRVYAPPSRSLLPVRRVADLMCNSVVGFLEAYVLQQILHPERVGLVVLEEQPYLVEVVLGTVGGAITRHPGFGEPISMLFEHRIHEARV